MAGADADSNFLDGRLCLLLEVEVIFEMGNFSQTSKYNQLAGINYYIQYITELVQFF